MPKNIVICSDGTGNSDIKGRGTNVFKLFEAIDLNGHRTDPSLDPQVTFYDDGVGTEDLKPLKILGGMVGIGLARNVRQLYRELARVYDPGDHIFLFGFSRGAFTVRTLAGMIACCGILNGTDVARLPTTKALRDAVDATYDAYRAGYDSYLTRLVGWMLRWPDRSKAVAQVHEQYPFHEPARIAFIGVWDTVDAVGTPFALGTVIDKVIYQFKFPTQDLSPSVDRACHALAIDDERLSFTPVLWREPAGGDPRIEQVWFAGVHSNVGGGYPKQGMSLVALDWMLRRAMEPRAAGARPVALRVQPLDLQLYQGHASVDDKLYDPRAGLGVFYRWAPRNIRALCEANRVPRRVHLSAVERIAHGTDDYAPGNLPIDAEVVGTRTGNPAADATAEIRAQAVQKVLYQASLEEPDVLAQVAPEIRLGQLSYWTFIASWVALVVAAVGVTMETMVAPPTFTGIVKAAATVVGDLVTLRVGAIYATLKGMVDSEWRAALPAAVIGLVLAWGLSRTADRRMTDVFSAFWHRRQAQLRQALKQARAEADAQLQGRHP